MHCLLGLPRKKVPIQYSFIFTLHTVVVSREKWKNHSVESSKTRIKSYLLGKPVSPIIVGNMQQKVCIRQEMIGNGTEHFLYIKNESPFIETFVSVYFPHISIVPENFPIYHLSAGRIVTFSGW